LAGRENKTKKGETMALETLTGVEYIDGFNVICMDALRKAHPEKFNESGAMDWKWFEKDIRPNNFIYIGQDKNLLSFTIQNGPIKESGINGCQVDTIVAAARMMIDGLNKKFPCRENAIAITKLDECLHWLKARKSDRENRGVEGYNKA